MSLLIITALVCLGVVTAVSLVFKAVIWVLATLVLALQEEIHLKQLDRIADTLERKGETA